MTTTPFSVWDELYNLSPAWRVAMRRQYRSLRRPGVGFGRIGAKETISAYLVKNA